MNSTVKERIIMFIKSMNIGQGSFEKTVGLSNGYVNNIRKSIQPDKLQLIARCYPSLNTGWLMTGEGEMLKTDSGVKFHDPKNAPSGKKLIPFYDDVSSFGGNLPGRSANIESNSPSTEWVDPGDWFKSATAALRHYGDSMTEYPTGCILALKEVQDRRLIIPGKDYVIETSEYRVTKKVQLCDNPEYIRAYSTNEEKYDDGVLIHQPFNIPLSLIGRLFEVLGYVVKKGGGTIVFSNQK
jgi:hypothetical protein